MWTKGEGEPNGSPFLCLVSNVGILVWVADLRGDMHYQFKQNQANQFVAHLQRNHPYTFSAQTDYYGMDLFHFASNSTTRFIVEDTSQYKSVHNDFVLTLTGGTENLIEGIVGLGDG